MSWVYLENVLTEKVMAKHKLSGESKVKVYITKPMELALLDKSNTNALTFHGASITINNAFNLPWINSPEWMYCGQVGKHLVFRNDGGLFIVIRNVFKKHKHNEQFVKDIRFNSKKLMRAWISYIEKDMPAFIKTRTETLELAKQALDKMQKAIKNR